MVVVVLVGVAMFVIEGFTKSAPTCDDIGVFVEGYDKIRQNRQAWVDAYNAGGGREVLG
jgi:diaminopimelate decarboxylase